METSAKQKGLKAGTQTGSLVNWMMSANSTLPEVGKGATEMLWTDRHAYQVTWVSEDQMSCKIRRCNAKRTDNNGHYTESQSYDYSELIGSEIELKFKLGAWRSKTERIIFEKEIDKKLDTDWGYINELRKIDNLWDQEGRLNVVDGISRTKIEWPKMSIIFGVQKEYCDPTF